MPYIQRNQYHYIHIGLFQLRIKPLQRLGLDTPLVYLIDARYHQFEIFISFNGINL